MSKDALIIGINTYKYLPSLKSPSEDAEAVAQVLEKYGEFNVRRFPAIKKEDAVRVGQKTEVTLGQLENELGKLFNPDGRSFPDTVLLFFSGHGMRKNRWGIQEGFLAASDTNIRTGNWGLSLKDLRNLFQVSPVRQQIILLDCCYSGELFNFDEAYPGDQSKARDLCFITASREFEVAYEEISGNHGILTGALLKGLAYNDEDVTNLLLCHFIAKTLKKEKATQKPVFRNFGEPIILTRCFKPPEPVREITVSVCPYKGLAYFDYNEEDHKNFHGRRELTDQLLEKVRKGNFVAVLGASGSGKSSLVRAGLLYQLTLGQRLSGSEQWQIRIFQPGENPLISLEFAFTESKAEFFRAKESLEKGAKGFAEFVSETIGDGRLVIVADQFEEVFTLCRDDAERQQFFEILLGASKLAGEKICLIITMRSDFFGKCSEQEYSGLADSIQSHLVTVIPMTPEELKQAITEPAKQAGLGAAFSKDETRILTWSEDSEDSEDMVYRIGTVRVWNASDGKPLTEPMKHVGWVKGAVFNRDESRILTWSEDGAACVWDIGADYDFPPEHLPLLVEVATGTTMDDFGTVSVLSKEQWEERKQKYIEIAEKHLKTCKYKEDKLYVRQKQAWGIGN